MVTRKGNDKNAKGSKASSTRKPRSKNTNSAFSDAMEAIDLENEIAAIAAAGEKIVLDNKPKQTPTISSEQKEKTPDDSPKPNAELPPQKPIIEEKTHEQIAEEPVISKPTIPKKEETTQVKKIGRGRRKKENALVFKHQFKVTTENNNLLFLLSNAPEFEEFESKTEILHYILEEYKKKKNIKEILDRGLSL